MRQMRLFTLTLFVLTFITASATAQYKVLYNFGSNSGDPSGSGSAISVSIAQGRDGNLYTTTPSGGANGLGAVFKITPAGALTVIHSFTGTDGYSPYGGLTLGTDGNFYGTTDESTNDCGRVFKITRTGSLTSYPIPCSDGNFPTAPPVQGTDGNLYGTTSALGGAGTLYKMTPSGTITLLYQFDGSHGNAPYAPLVQGSDGNFYGTTVAGGSTGLNLGVIFKVTSTGKLTVIHNFDGTHGTSPYAPLVQGSDGSFYGTTSAGGTSNAGVAFKITPTGSFTVLHNMNGTSDGSAPVAGLVQATDGNLYGANASGGTASFGTLFKSTPTSFSVLYNFDDKTGSAPYATPFQHTNGILYGDTALGGTIGVGVFYRFNANLPAFVSLLPYWGKVGNTIEFLGQGFTTSTTVSFNGKAASSTVVSGTYLTATVPSGATTGYVTVTTSSGTLKSNKIFRVTPQITSFSPTSGPVGTSVIIKGISLKQTTKVTFGGVPATSFTVDSDTQVTATVPSGVKTGKISVSVTTPGGTASGTFTVT